MDNKTVLNETWIKASIVGTIWAASEIVLGSFLHNLKIPFSGNILTAIAIIIMVSISYTWTEKGLFWRAGLICAIMKTMSPSAVIFGPMIAIFSEAALLEISVRLLGKTVLGYMLGAMLAMSWNLFQKIMNYIVFYGFNIVKIYTDLLQFAQKQLKLNIDLVWFPIILLLIIYCVLGILSAMMGIKIGRRLLSQPNQPSRVYPSKNIQKKDDRELVTFHYSIFWLVANILLIIVAFILLSKTPVYISSSFIIVVVSMWIIRYKRAMRQLSRPRFWIFFVFITMITAFVFSRFESLSITKGFITGVEMNLRAVVVILGFSVLGTELYNPRIREFFLKTTFKQLPLALELSFESLPAMVTNIPEFKSILRDPVSVLYGLISQAETRLAEIKQNLSRKIFIITGQVGSGKTTFVKQFVSYCKAANIRATGVCSMRIMEDGITSGYDIEDITSGNKEIFLRRSGSIEQQRIGRYYIYNPGLAMGTNILQVANNKESQIIIIDEVGNLELEGKGWAGNLSNLIDQTNKHLLLIVRDTHCEKVISKWALKNCVIYTLSESDLTALSHSIIQAIT